MTKRGMPIGRLDSLPRAVLMSFETPIEEMPNLGAATGGATLFVKRDDLTGLALGGNKVRQLEYYLGEAVEQEADTILITGAVQSNFVRLAAAAARKCGMDCHLQLEERVPKNDPVYKNSGNVLLDKVLGATIHSYPDGEDEEGADANLHEIASGLKGEGRRPYIIHLAPGHPPLGALGYVDAAREIVAQSEESGIEFDEVVVASGSGNTHAGLLFGLRAAGSEVPVTGVCVRRAAEPQKPRLMNRCQQIADLLQMDNVVKDDDIVLLEDHLAPGYGRMSETVKSAFRLAATTEGLITDPVYTSKTMAGFIDRARDSGAGKRLLFIHTGGQPALFAYEKDVA